MTRDRDLKEDLDAMLAYQRTCLPPSDPNYRLYAPPLTGAAREYYLRLCREVAKRHGGLVFESLTVANEAMIYDMIKAIRAGLDD